MVVWEKKDGHLDHPSPFIVLRLFQSGLKEFQRILVRVLGSDFIV